MNTKRFSVWIGVGLLVFSSFNARAAIIDLYGYSLNIDGTVSDVVDDYETVATDPFLDPVPGGVDVSLFDDISGLGTITATITGQGDHFFGAFFDHEIDETINTYFNEFGSATGAVAAGQSWEIDEPGFLFGDIFDNFYDSILDNSNSLPAGSEDDVSMALGWDFTLALDQIAIIDLTLSEIMPGSGFFLTHHDPDSNQSIYFSSTLSIASVPEPPMLFLLGIGLTGLLLNRRKLK